MLDEARKIDREKVANAVLGLAFAAGKNVGCCKGKRI
jgi:hypothetical protein